MHTQIPPTGYVGLMTQSVLLKLPASQSTLEDTLMIHFSYCDRSTVHSVSAAHPQSTLNGTPTAVASAVVCHMRPM